MSIREALRKFTYEKIDKLLREGFVVSSNGLEVRRVHGRYELWGSNSEEWFECPWRKPLYTMSVVAADAGYIQYTADEFSIIKYSL